MFSRVRIGDIVTAGKAFGQNDGAGAMIIVLENEINANSLKPYAGKLSSGRRAVNQLQRSNKRYALASMCVGVGMGYAVILERV